MACENCFNGCVETTSDKCVKYTGQDYPELDISTGDNLLSVETSIITFLKSALNGTGILMTISEDALCDLVSTYLPVSGEITLVDYIIALLKSSCALKELIDTNKESIDKIEANYEIGCLEDVAPEDGTHDVVQAVITKLCTVESNLGALAQNLSTNYVRIDEIDSYIAAYLADNTDSTLIRNRMVPNTIVEYYGSLSNFDASGAGLGDWAQIYLCNGNNLTPDKRGRSPIGVVTGMGGGAYNSVVDPINPLNPNYTILSTGGANVVSLTTPQIPNHTHTATVTDPGHTHPVKGSTNTSGGSSTSNVVNNVNNNTSDVNTQVAYTNISVDIIPTGGGESHPNVHPVLACYYIMYIPS